MELCAKTLRDVMYNELKVETIEKLAFKTIYVLYELFKEIVESINYLHKQKPPIIHRDLKPSNILLTNGSSGRFIKLADFGIAVFHERESQSHTAGVGSENYMAPEVKSTKSKSKYGVKADVFSLGMILRDLFNCDLNE